MKIMRKITAFAVATSLLCAAIPVIGGGIAVAATTSDKVTYVTFEPKTDINGNELNTVSRYDFSTEKNGIRWVYNDDWADDTYSLGYGNTTVNGNAMYYINTMGGGYMPRLKAYIANGTDISAADGVYMYVDNTMLKDTSDFSFGFGIYLSAYGDPGFFTPDLAANLQLKDGSTGYFYDIETGLWNSGTVSDDKIALGDNFRGYVMFPLTAFSHVEETDMLYLSGCNSFSDLTSEGLVYLNRIRIYTEVGDTWESQTPFYIDDLTFVSTGELHAHNYVFNSAVSPECTVGGYDIYTCAECGSNVKRNLTQAVGHSYGAWKYGSDGTAYRVCADCRHVETDAGAEAETVGDDDLVTITFDYGAAGGSVDVKFLRGAVIGYADIPYKMTYFDRYTYQFNCWTSDIENVEPLNPEGKTADADMTYYARYVIASYANKYMGVCSILAFNGGCYYRELGKVLGYGNSQMGLYHTMESDFASDGFATYNNSVCGSTGYDMLNSFDVLVRSYKPKIIVTNVSSNDFAYYFMSYKDIIANMEEFYNRIRRYLPDTYIIFTSMYSIPGRPEFLAADEYMNIWLYNFCETHEMAEVVDVNYKVSDYCKNYPVGWEFWTHLELEGIQDMFLDVRTAIRRYLGANGIVITPETVVG